MLFPKKAKYRKWQTGRKNVLKRNRPDTRGTTMSFGSYGLKAMGQARVTSNQIEAARKVIVRTIGKTGKMWIRIFPDRPFTRKAAEVGMGKGKGDPQGYVSEVRAGRILFEVEGVSEEVARAALRKAGMKMSMKTKAITRK